MRGEQMASLSNDAGGGRRILFVAPDGKRKAIRLGAVPAKQAGAKPRTLTNLRQAADKLTAHFGTDAPLDRVTAGAADDWAAALRRDYAPAYVARLVKYGKQFFRAARRAGLVASNPFDDV